MTAGFSIACVLACLLLSLCLQFGHCQYYQEIDLTSSYVSCNMSSMYSISLNCTGAINGNTNMTWASARDRNPNCIYTDNHRSQQFWLVNLGQTHNIHKIIIYPETIWNLMANISVLVDWIEVFRFPSNRTRLSGPENITLNPPLRGQFIQLRKENAYVTLCELQVYECVSGRYGTGCRRECNAGCLPDTCDSIYGNCTCRTGWSGFGCHACSVGYYNSTVPDSSACRKCSAGCKTISCDDVIGNCACRSGWQAPTCEGVCVPGQFGPNCQQTCSAGCDDTCDVHTGACTCKQGWIGPTCEEVCVPGQFGPNCQQTCSAGCDDTCDVHTGACTCKQGWIGPTCEVCATGYYSSVVSGNGSSTPRDCTPCGSGCANGTCDGQAGSCTCRLGWQPPFCDQDCRSGFWGDNCTVACGYCAGDEPCNQETGECLNGACVAGWTGSTCTEQLKVAAVADDGDSNTGAIVGAVVGAGVFLGICVIVGALLLRYRRFQTARGKEVGGNTTSRVQETETAMEFSGGTSRPEREQGDGSDNYDKLANYENTDDIKLYTSLQTHHPTTHEPHKLKKTASDTSVYEIPDVEYENT